MGLTPIPIVNGGSKNMSKFTKAIGVFTLSAIGLAAQAIPVTQTIQTFGMVGLAEGQTAELNVLNPGIPPPALGVICSATLSFLNDQGDVLKTTTVSVEPGKSAAFYLYSDVDLKLALNDRREIRATVKIPPVFPPNAAAMPPVAACNLFPTLEIFDALSRRTQLVMAKTETIPSPLTPATP
jgi:hypothetical protein